MKTTLDFEKEDTKKLLAELDFEFFLKQNIEEEKYSQADIDAVYKNYKEVKASLYERGKKNRKQFNYYLEGQVRKMFTGGALPALFHLNEARRTVIFDFKAYGEAWAYFEKWQKYYKRKITKEKVWNFIVKAGSILAFALSVIKIFEFINKINYD